MENVAKFRLHGRYVGPGHTGALTLGEYNFRARPLDSLDAAARNHDYSYQQSNNRADSDFILADRAFEVAKNNQNLKYTANVVGLGMTAKGLLEYNPWKEPTHYFDRPANEYLRPNRSGNVMKDLHINGNNGSWTNSDDVQKLTPAQQSKRDKAIHAARMKNQKQQKPKPPKGGGQSMGGKAGNVYPTGLPIISERPYLGNATKGRPDRCQKRVKILPLVTPATIIAPGHVFASFEVDRGLFATTQISRYFQRYEKWRCNSCRFEAVPALATNTAGTAWITADVDANDQLIVGDVKDLDYFANHTASIEHSVFGAKWSTTLRGSSRELFTDLPNLTSNATEDQRLSSAGVITFTAGASLTTTSTQMATMWAVVDFDFWSEAFTEDEDVIFAVKGNGTAANPGTVFESYAYMPPNYVWPANEYSYQQGRFDGTNFLLKTGFYFYNFVYMFNGATGSVTPALGIVSNPVYSADVNNIGGANTTNFEWANSPSLVNPVAQYQQIGYIRVTNYAAGYNNFVFSPNITTTNSVTLTGFGVYIARLPGILGGRYLDWFPKGNSASSIEYEENGERKKKPAPPCKSMSETQSIMSKAEYEDFLMWRQYRNNAVSVRIEETDEKVPEIPIMIRDEPRVVSTPNQRPSIAAQSWLSLRR